MIWNAIFWYISIALAGVVIFPLAYRLFPFLPDRGLSVARPLGLLIWGYLYWLLVSFGLIQNDSGGVFTALLINGALSVWALLHDRWQQVILWLRQNWKTALASEIVFLVAFLVMAVVRAAVPEASGTEKPMDLAFVNSILRSQSFPPADPWLSGYAISYYYFGHILVAMLARFSGTPGAVAFNLSLASWFALTASAAFCLVYNLLALRGIRSALSRVNAVLGPLFVLAVSNLEGFLELLHARGIFWQQAGQNTWASEFWQWLNIQELTNPPSPPLQLAPERMGGIWWWRASRVLQDFDLAGQPREIIDEFPAFSFLLGDLHPHLLAMPFVVLAAVLALNAFLAARSRPSTAQLTLRSILNFDFWLAAVILGSLAFLNTWDFPIYLALFAASMIFGSYLREGWGIHLIIDLFLQMLVLGFAGAVLYLPFYFGFASQAGGFLSSLVFFTRGVYFWIMFAPLLLPVFAWLIWLWRQQEGPKSLSRGLLFSVAVIGGLWLISLLYAVVSLRRSDIAGIYGAGPDSPLVITSILQRFLSPGTWLTLLVLLALIWGLFSAFRSRRSEDGETLVVETAANADSFVLLVVMLGAGLVLFPEFFYLRDQFGWRMNTIFKFYFQAWILWALAAGYASAVIWEKIRGAYGTVLRIGWSLLLLMSLVYPLFGVWSRTNGFQPSEWTLDGEKFLENFNPQDMAAISWLKLAEYGVVAEAVGGSYTGFARVSTHSGLPTVLGWPGHESQWRGGAEEMGSRQQDMEQLYRTNDWQQARQVLEKYNIRYVFVGSLERAAYRPSEELFERYLRKAYSSGSTIIYEYSPTQQEQASQE